MRIVVVGAGAWGLPTAAELARRHHEVILVDRHGPGNPLSSSGGPTRLWRVADPDRAAIRLGARAVEAMRRLEHRIGRPTRTRTGLLWRDAPDALRTITTAVAAEGVDHAAVDAPDVGRVFPGLVPDGRDALWFPEAGALLSAVTLDGCRELLARHGATTRFGPEVTAVEAAGAGARVRLAGGEHLAADVVVVCAGPGTAALLPGIGLDVPLRGYLEQVVHLGDPGDPHRHDDMPCLFDGPGPGRPGVYAMPTPGVGYKLGIDDPLREWAPDDTDRAPDAARTSAITARAHALVPSLGQTVVDALVCCWTDSPDGWFVVDRVGSVVVACGDSGKGFKYSAVMGEVLADLAEGGEPDADVAAMSAARFAGRDPGAPWLPTSLGSVGS